MVRILSPHPAPSTIRRVVQSFAGVGEQGGDLVLQVEEITIRRRVGATGRKAAGRVGRDIEATGSGGKDLIAYGKQVTEGAVRSVRAAGRPGTALVSGHLDGVVAWIDAEELSLGEEASADFYHLRHKACCFVIIFRCGFYGRMVDCFYRLRKKAGVNSCYSHFPVVRLW